MKRSFFQAAVTSILLYGCTTWTLTKRLERKLDGNYTRILRAILNKSWWQHHTRHQLYGHMPPITKTIQTCFYKLYDEKKKRKKSAISEKEHVVSIPKINIRFIDAIKKTLYPPQNEKKQYKKPFIINLFFILLKKSTPTMKFRFLVY